VSDNRINTVIFLLERIEKVLNEMLDKINKEEK